MDARWSDVFGESPELSGRLQAKIWTIATACQIVSPLVGAQIFARDRLAGFWCSACALMLQTIIVFSSNETLAEKDRKPFSLKTVNPFSNIAILFTNGPGLRGLSLAAAFMEATKGTWSTQETYRFSALKWTPTDDSYFDAVFSAIGAAYNSLVTERLLKAWGPKKTCAVFLVHITLVLLV